MVFLALFLALFDWNWARGGVGRFVSGIAGREVRFEDHLEMRLLRLTPFMEAHGVYVGQPGWVSSPTPMVDAGMVRVAVSLPNLLRGQLVLPELTVVSGTVDLRREKDGRANWMLNEKKDASRKGALPLIRNLKVQDGNVKLVDKKMGLNLVGTVSSEEGENVSGTKPFKLEGKGTLNSKDFALVVNGGSLLNAKAGTAYPFELDMTAMRTRVKATGQLRDGLDPRTFDAQVTVSGNDLADLYYLTGLVFPNTPAYTLKGRVVRAGDMVDVKRFDGAIGGSDVRGDVQVNLGGERPRMVADVVSRKLDFRDLGTLLGGPPPAGKTGGAEGAERPAVTGRIFPDAPLQVERVRSMDAQVSYHAESVNLPQIPLSKVAMEMTLEHGVLRLDPVTFKMPQGEAKGTIQIDAQPDVPVVDVDMRLRGMTLEQFVKTPKGEIPMVSGTVAARVKVQGRGASVRDAAATATGAVTVVIPHGQVRQAFAELMGTNVARGLGLLVTGSQEQTEIRCGVASFTAKDGILENTLFVLDTGVVVANGKGTVNLRNEELDLTVKGEPKHARFIRVGLPIHVRGTLLKPRISADLEQAAGQASVAAALGVVLTPLASVLPFIDAGLAEDANCRTLMREARKGVAAVNVAVPPSPTAR